MPGFFEAVVNGKGNGPLTAAWVIEGPAAGAKALSDRQGILYRDGLFPEEAAGEILKTAGPAGIVGEKGSRIFLERIADGKKLVICGAGHVALCVIRLGVMLGYEITVIEDRKEFAGKAREAGAHQVFCKPFGEALDGIEEDPSAAFVIMTREHSHDVECLRRILPKAYGYVGMMGSRSRTEEIRRQMLEEGFDAQKIAQLHMPIGLPIGSRTPEEIAVSVAAELISVMNSQQPGEGFPPGMAEELAAGGSGALAMIAEKSGEAPRRPGTKMLVREDGSSLGTVGGGYAEAQILKEAAGMLRETVPESRLVRITMQKGTMHCGGEITVFLVKV